MGFAKVFRGARVYEDHYDGLSAGDNDILYFGDALDVSLKWDGTNLVLLPVADDTGSLRIGNGTLDFDVRVTLGATADYFQLDVGAKSLIMAGDARLDLSSATIAAANTDGGVVKAGTSAAAITENTANMKFMSFYWSSGTATGVYGIYNRLYLTGAAAEGDAFRSFATVSDVAAGTVRGAHISLSFATSGTITGLGAALETTLHIPSTAGQTGTITSINAAINSDAATSDPVGATSLSVFRVSNQGNSTGMADVDDDCVLFDFAGWGVATGDMLYDSTGTDPTNSDGSIKIRLPSGALAYLLYYDQQAA